VCGVVEAHRQHAVDDDRADGHAEVAQGVDTLDRLGHRHLLQQRDEEHAGAALVEHEVDEALRLGADRADIHELRRRVGGAQEVDDPACGRGVDNDEVVVEPPVLVPAALELPDLADQQHVLEARRRSGRELHRGGAHDQPGDAAGAVEPLQVLRERGLRVDRQAVDAGAELALLEVPLLRV
jgi:hypothetical protein